MNKTLIKDYPSYTVFTTGYILNSHGRLMRVKNRKKGYKAITLSKKGKAKTFLIHRLVMMSFKPIEGFEELDVNHIDGNTSNNNLENLEWCTRKQNMEHAIKTGLMPCSESHHLSKLSNNDIESIKSYYDQGFTQHQIAKDFGVGQDHVSRIVNNKVRTRG